MLMRSKLGCGSLLKPVGIVGVTCETPVMYLLSTHLPQCIHLSHRGTRRQKQSVLTHLGYGTRQLILTELG